jgi:orotidine 5'-phosphate decarboxylase subfamily 2
VIDAIQEESNRMGSMIPVVLDAKRGDIASTAEAYAKSAFENLEAHCITLSPYLGKDSIEPFIQDSEKGIFLLCKTSNPGSTDLQDVLVLDHERGKTKEDDLFPLSSFVPLHIKVAQLAQQWNTRNNIGLVVGATYPRFLPRSRGCACMWFLAPGIGAQGGELESALKAGLRQDGKGCYSLSHARSRALKSRGSPQRNCGIRSYILK